MNTALPEIFLPFLDSLTFDPPDSESEPVAVIAPPKSSFTATGHHFFKPPVLLYQTRTTEATIHGFRRKLLAILREANHVATDSIADTILACGVGASHSGADRLGFFTDLLTRFSTAEVSHFLVLPHPAPKEDLCFEGYCLGKINLLALQSRCRRAKSDYADLYGDDLSGRLCLMSPDFPHVVLDFLHPMIHLKLRVKPFWMELLLDYFELVSRLHFECMWAHLDRTQVLCRPFNAAMVDVHALRYDLGRLCDKVTIYLDFSTVAAGYVVPEAQGSTAVQIGSAADAFFRYKAHRTAYHLDEVGNSELGRKLFECANFCQQAARFLETDRTADAALYATICLEQLFSEKTNTADAVCTRTATLTHLRQAASYSDAVKEMKKLYNARSDFVHSGTPVTSADAHRLISYARETLRSLLVLHIKPDNRSGEFFKQWVKTLDFISSGFAAGKTFEDAFLAENGIFRS